MDIVNAVRETHSSLVCFNVIENEPIKVKIPSLKLFLFSNLTLEMVASLYNVRMI